jgi:hypothetical protein
LSAPVQFQQVSVLSTRGQKVSGSMIDHVTMPDFIVNGER